MEQRGSESAPEDQNDDVAFRWLGEMPVDGVLRREVRIHWRRAVGTVPPDDLDADPAVPCWLLRQNIENFVRFLAFLRHVSRRRQKDADMAHAAAFPAGTLR